MSKTTDHGEAGAIRGYSQSVFESVKKNWTSWYRAAGRERRKKTRRQNQAMPTAAKRSEGGTVNCITIVCVKQNTENLLIKSRLNVSLNHEANLGHKYSREAGRKGCRTPVSSLRMCLVGILSFAVSRPRRAIATHTFIPEDNGVSVSMRRPDVRPHVR